MAKQSLRIFGTAQLTDSEVLHSNGEQREGRMGRDWRAIGGEQTELVMFSRKSHQDGSKASGLGFGG